MKRLLLILLPLGAFADTSQSTNALEIAQGLCSYTNAPCAACMKRAEAIVRHRVNPKVPRKGSPKPARGINLLNKKYPVKGRK